MGPTTVALVRLNEADQKLREAQSRLDAVTKDVRVQERRVNELSEKLRLAQTTARQLQSKAGQLDLDLKARDAHIEKLREQQGKTTNNREYQAFLIEINTSKIDRSKVEEEAIRTLEAVDKANKEAAALGEQVSGEQAKLQQMRDSVNDKVAALQAEIETLKPARQEAAGAVPAKALAVFDRLAEHNDGEAMAAISKPDKKVEEYICLGCYMTLVADVYNRLRTRDEVTQCPSCRRILFIPDDLPPEAAVNKPKPKREPRAKKVGAAIGRQTSAVDVLASMKPDEDDTPAPPPAPAKAPASDASSAAPSPASETSSPAVPPPAVIEAVSAAPMPSNEPIASEAAASAAAVSEPASPEVVSPDAASEPDSEQDRSDADRDGETVSSASAQ